MNGLTPQQVSQFEADGCIVIPGELRSDVVRNLLEESRRLLAEFSLDNHPMTRFSTGDKGQEHIGDQYFLDSSDNISFFFEQDAFDDSGKLTRAKNLAVNKIGHALHKYDPSFLKVSINDRNLAIAKSLGFQDPRVLQSMLIFKQPEIGGLVPVHQDGTFLYTKPQSAIGWWYALEDCTETNGALEFVPGSHKWAGISKRFVKKLDGAGTEFIDVEGVEDFAVPEESQFKMLQCPAGSLVLIHNSVLHRSRQNTSSQSRFAYAFHVIDGVSEYDDRNWLQIPVSGGSNFSSLSETKA